MRISSHSEPGNANYMALTLGYVDTFAGRCNGFYSTRPDDLFEPQTNDLNKSHPFKSFLDPSRM